MAEQTSRSTLSETQVCVVLENVIEYISDISTLISLTVVSKRVRSLVYRSNGLREVHLACDFDFVELHWRGLVLNGIGFTGENEEEKLKEGLRWLWSVGKRLKTVSVTTYFGAVTWYLFDSVLPLLNSLAATEKRRIETIEISGMLCEWAIDLVKENSSTLRHLRVELWDLQAVSACSSQLLALLRQCSSERTNFCCAVQQCQRLASLDLYLKAPTSIPTALWNVLCGTPLKHLNLRTYDPLTYYEFRHNFIAALLSDNLCNSLESLTLDYYIFHLIFQSLTGDMTGPRSSAAFMNISKLVFGFVTFCCQGNPINWSVFLAVFPALNEIKDNSFLFVRNTSDIALLSQNVSFLCKTYLEVTESQSREMKIEIHGSYSRTDSEQLIAAVAMAATLPEDQDWCVSHGVQIETEARDEKVERVTLRKDTSKLVFDLK